MSPKRKDTLMSGYERNDFESTENFGKSLDEVAREGARRMLVSVLESEVEEFLGRKRYERQADSGGYRNGYGKKRKVAIGSGTRKVEVMPVLEI